MDVDSSSQEEVSAVQVYWTPNLGCNLRVDLNTGVPEYDNYLKSASWITRRALRAVGDGGVVVYAKQRSRVFPENAPVASLKIKPDDVPRHPGHQDVTAYFPHGEKAVTDLLEGQLAFLSHVRLYEENHPGTHILQQNLVSKYEFLCYFLGCLDEAELATVTTEIRDVSNLSYNHGSWAVKTSKAMSRILRHDERTVLGKYMECSLEGFQRTSVRPYDWHPRKFFSFLMANSKGRFNIWVAPVALTFGRFLDWDFHIGVSATQGHSRVPDQVSEISRGERLSIERCRKLGMIFHATDNANYEGIREKGLVLEATRASWQRHRLAIHFVYAGGVTSPGPGTAIKYGPYVFYCNLDYESYLNHGHELYLTDNGVVLSYESIAPMYLTFHYRPPHEKDPGGLRHEREQNAAGVGSSHEEGTSATASASASGSSPQGEAPGSNTDPKARPAPKKRPKTAQTADASPDMGSSPQGEVPTLDAEALRKLIRDNELREDRERRQATTHSEGSTRYAYQSGDTVHGKVDAHKAQQEELNEVLRKARTNPWHLFAHGVLHRTDGSGQRMFSTFDDPLVKVTPWHTLSKEMHSWEENTTGQAGCLILFPAILFTSS